MIHKVPYVNYNYGKERKKKSIRVKSGEHESTFTIIGTKHKYIIHSIQKMCS